MEIQDLRITVGRTWRFAAGARTCVATNTSGYRHRIDQLKGAPAGADFGLPWPDYPSHLWRYMLAPDYRALATPLLVAALLPLRWSSASVEVPANAHHPETGAAPAYKIAAEAIWHPFGVTTLLHARSEPPATLPEDASAAYDALDGLFGQGVPVQGGDGGPGVVEAGLALDDIPALATSSFEGEDLTTVSVDQFVLLSGLHHSDSGLEAASALARRFGDAPDPKDAVPLRSSKSGLSIEQDTVAAVLSSDYPRAGEKLGCLHHNYALLLAYMSSLAGILSGETTESADWFRRRAGLQLHGLCGRTPHQPLQSVYKSRAAEEWIRARGLVAAINGAVAGEGVVPIPES